MRKLLHDGLHGRNFSSSLVFMICALIPSTAIAVLVDYLFGKEVATTMLPFATIMVMFLIWSQCG